MFERLDAVAKRYDEIEQELVQAAEAGDTERLTELARERAEIEELVTAYREYQRIAAQLADTEALANGSDPDMAELARDDLSGLKAQRDSAEARLRELLVPKDPNDEKDVF